MGAVACTDRGISTSHNGAAKDISPLSRAETRLIRKIPRGTKEIFVARTLKTGEYANARPCPTCMKALKLAKVGKVYFTLNDTSYGVIDLIHGEEWIVTRKK